MRWHIRQLSSNSAPLAGRHRYYACQETGVDPEFREYEGNDPRGFVVSLNLKRRHLDASQRSAVAAELATLKSGGIREGQNTIASQTANLQSEVTQTEAATMQ